FQCKGPKKEARPTRTAIVSIEKPGPLSRIREDKVKSEQKRLRQKPELCRPSRRLPQNSRFSNIVHPWPDEIVRLRESRIEALVTDPVKSQNHERTDEHVTESGHRRG